MSVARSGLGAVSLNGKIYAMGGYDGSGFAIGLNLVEEYDPATDKWTTKTPMKVSRYELGVTSLNGKIYAIGGYNGSVLNLVEEYDPATDKWTTKQPMSVPRCGVGVASLNGKIYAMGGHNGNSSRLNLVEEYDPATDKWTTKAPMSVPMDGVGATSLNGKIYAIGSGINSVQEYDPTTDKWTTKKPMSTSRFNMGVASLNGKVYAIGGCNGSSFLNSVEEYDLATDKRTIKTPMSTARRCPGIATLNDEIYVIGGQDCDGSENLLNTMEKYTLPPIPMVALTATSTDAKVNLSWNSVEGATTYNIKRSETAGGPYTQIGNVTTNVYTDTNVTNGKTYYYVVTAVTGTSESANSNEAAATLAASSIPTNPKQMGNRAILEIKMINGEIQEYDLSSSGLSSFLTWYNDRSGGAAKAYYIMDKNYNVKPFLSRQLYIPFDKIMEYEVKSYNN